MSYVKIFDNNLMPLGVVDKDDLSTDIIALIINGDVVPFGGKRKTTSASGIYSITIVTPYTSDPQNWTAINVANGNKREFKPSNTQESDVVAWSSVFATDGTLTLYNGSKKCLTIKISSYYIGFGDFNGFIGSLD